MTLEELRARVIFQINADLDDLGDYEPHLDGYIDAGYDEVLDALLHKHTGAIGFPVMEEDDDEPNLPVWMHKPIADYATWLCYRNGNPQKQSRGLRFLESFNQKLAKVMALSGQASYNEETGELTIGSEAPQFFNVYP